MKCLIDGCDRTGALRRGWCNMHYVRWRTRGDPLYTKMIIGDDLARFWTYVDKNGPTPAADTLAAGKGPCWFWKGSKIGRGDYGGFHIGGRKVPAHRYAYESLVGAIPSGLEIDHLCRVRNCVNPDHLEPVTPRENQRRSPLSPSAANAAKTHCINGHEFDEENTYVRPNGERRCRACERESRRRERAALRSREPRPVPMVKHWEVYSLPYEVVEPVLDDGSGPMVTVVDWVEVVALDWESAKKAGCAELERQFGRQGWIGQRRSARLYPYTGVHCRLLSAAAERAQAS